MNDLLQKYIHNEYIFFGVWSVFIAGIVGIIYLILNSKQTTRLIDLGLKYLEARKKNTDYFVDVVTDLKHQLQEAQVQINDMRNHITVLETQNKYLTDKLKQYEAERS